MWRFVLAAAFVSGCVQPSTPEDAGTSTDSDGGATADADAGAQAPDPEAVRQCDTLLDAAAAAIRANCPGRSAYSVADLHAALETSLPAPCAQAVGMRDLDSFKADCLPALAVAGFCPESQSLPEACVAQILFPVTSDFGDGKNTQVAVDACNAMVAAYVDKDIELRCEGATADNRADMLVQVEKVFPGGCAEADSVRDATQFETECLPALRALTVCPTSDAFPESCVGQIQFSP